MSTRRTVLAGGGTVTVLCLALLLVATAAWAAAGWTAQSSGTASALSAVACTSPLDGWAVGAAGTILVTSDGGETWAAPTTPVPTTHDLSGVAFADAGHGWAVGAAGTILVTSDGGETWAAPTTPVPTTHDLAGVAFVDACHGWAVGAAGTILTTTNGGATWAAPSAPVPTTHDLSAVAFIDAGHGWTAGAAGTILATSDGGATWAAQTAPAGTPDLAGAAFVGAKQGWVVGAGGTVLETLSAGIPDVTAPVTSTTGLQADGHSGWRNAAQTVTLKRADAGSGVAATYVVVDGGQPQTYTGPFVLAAPGSHAVSYWSVDLVGNVETRHTGYVNIDTGRPVCLAAKNVKARPGTLVRFSYRVQDALPSCGKAVVTITIYRGHTIVKTVRLTGIKVNARRIYDYRVNLAHGTYTWVVTAKDLAGNVQSKAGKKQLRVVTWVIHNTADVQRCLAALGYLPHGAVSGVDDYRTQQALMAFQAWNGLSRDGIDGRKTRAKLENGTPPTPRKESATGHYAEVFRSLGVLLCVNNGKLVRAVHCSTGRPSLPTPAGRFSIYLKSLDWWSTKYLDWMPFASFFSGGDAIHGFPDVPAYPASHGCVRVSMPEASWVYSFLYYGATVFVY
jgi:photosystem II stability/assembly factor-like uncharacterized protein